MIDYIVTYIKRNEEDYLAAACYDDRQLIRLHVEKKEETSRVGWIINGVTEKLLPNIDGAFVRISKSEQAFLPSNGARLNGSQKIPVLITKDPHDHKQATCSQKLSLQGRTCVVSLGKPGLSFSRKLSPERKESIKLEFNHDLCISYQVLIRTNAGQAEISEIEKEAADLEKILSDIRDNFSKKNACTVLYRPEPFYEAILRDMPFTPDRVRSDIPLIAEELKAELYEDKVLSLSDLKSLNSDIDKLMNRKVNLRSGAFLIIEETEAFVSIDVNTGKCSRGQDPEETYLHINKEAAAEIIRQLVLRNLSGMILVDFISMKDKEHEKELLSEARRAAETDPLHTEIIDITPLGIMEMVRQKREKTLREVLKIDKNIV